MTARSWTSARNRHLYDSAHRAVEKATRDGVMPVRPLTCGCCGCEPEVPPDGAIQIIWHHTDYAHPLKVVPLCRKCHGKAHMGRLGNEMLGYGPNDTIPTVRAARPKTITRFVPPPTGVLSLTDARRIAGLSVAGLASAVGKSRTTVWRWEQPGRIDEPSASDLPSITDACGLSSLQQRDLCRHFTARKDAA